MKETQYLLIVNIMEWKHVLMVIGISILSFTTLLGQIGCDQALMDTGFGTKFPGPNWEVGDLTSGTYGLFNVVAGTSYEFSTCTDNTGVGSTNFDTQLSLRRDDDNSEILFNDDANCSYIRASTIEWTADFTGNVRLALFEFEPGGNCGSTGISTGIAWRSVEPAAEQPDYIAEAVFTENPLPIGTPFSISSTIFNAGGATEQTIIARYYLSQDSFIDELDIQLGDEVIEPIGAGENYQGGLNASLADELDLAPGSYYIICWVDPNGELDESDPGNNLSFFETEIPVAGKPDYALLNPKVSSSTVSPGQQITAEIEIKNVGSMDGPSSLFVHYYYSTNNTWESSDQKLGADQLDSIKINQTIKRTEQITIPSNASGGIGYIIFRVDQAGTETNMSNNFANVQINISSNSLVDYTTVAGSSRLVDVGQVLVSSTTITNSGTAPSNSNSKIGYYLRDYQNSNFSIQLKETSINPLGAGQDFSEHARLVFPKNLGLSAGHYTNYYLSTIADKDNDVAESNEGNNEAIQSLQLYVPNTLGTPDYALEEFVLTNPAPVHLIPGSLVTYRAKVKNIGDGDVAGMWLDGMAYYSHDDSFDSSIDQQISAEDILPLAIGEDTTFNVSSQYTKIPTNAVPGTRYLFYRVDDEEILNEPTPESNNLRRIEIIVSPALNRPNLGPHTLSIDPQYLPLGYWKGYVTIENISTISTISTISNFYYSEDEELDDDDVLIGESPVETIGPDQELNVDFNFQIPDELIGQAGYLIALIDPNNELEESDEEDNVLAEAIPISQQADLTIQLKLLFSDVDTEQSLKIDTKITNSGTQNAGATDLVFYLSQDARLEENNPQQDKPLLTLPIAALNAGDQIQNVISVPIPKGMDINLPTPGVYNYYIIARVDDCKVVPEQYEFNNVDSKPIYIGVPDNPGTVDYVPVPGTPGTRIGKSPSGEDIYGVYEDGRHRVYLFVFNKGTGDVKNMRASVKQYFSLDDNLDPQSDLLLNTDPTPLFVNPVKANQPSPETVWHELDMPQNTGPISGYIFTVIDSENIIKETNETNNTLKTRVQFIPRGYSPDLIVKKLDVSPSMPVGAYFLASETIENIGKDVAAYLPSTTNKYYLSRDKTLDLSGANQDVFLGTTSTPQLKANGTHNELAFLQIPPNTNPGIYYLLLHVDADDKIDEEFEGNNYEAVRIVINTAPITFLPDLIPSFETVDQSILPGSSFPIPGITLNQSPEAHTTSTIGTFFFSLDQELSEDDLPIGQVEIPELAPGEIMNFETELMLPLGTASGEGFIILQVNPNGTMTEHDVENNTVFRQVFISPAPTWEVQQTGFNHTVIIPDLISVQIDTNHLTTGDFIGAFYRDGSTRRCAGKGQWTGTSMAMAVFGDDIYSLDKEGFANGEVFEWRIWRANSQTESIVNAEYLGPNGVITHTNTFAADGLSQISSFRLDPSELQVIQLNAGWNLISTYLNPYDPEMEKVFDEVKESIHLVKNNVGEVYYPAASIDNIGNWDPTQGYKVKIESAKRIEISGESIDPNTPIRLETGWNMIGFLSDLPIAAESHFASILDQIILAKDIDGNVFLPEYGINGIGELQPGKGYQVQMKESATLTPASSQREADSEMHIPVLSATHFVHQIRSGHNATLIIQAEDQFEFADEIGVFDKNGQLVGSGVYERHPMVITIWGDDPFSEGKEGLYPGEAFDLRHWRADKGIEEALLLNYENEKGEYVEDAILFANASIATSLKDEINMNEKIVLYPNPASAKVRLQLNLNKTAQFELRLINFHGQVIYRVGQQEIATNSDEVEIDLQPFAEGLYQVQILLDGRMYTKPLVIKH